MSTSVSVQVLAVRHLHRVHIKICRKEQFSCLGGSAPQSRSIFEVKNVYKSLNIMARPCRFFPVAHNRLDAAAYIFVLFLTISVMSAFSAAGSSSLPTKGDVPSSSGEIAEPSGEIVRPTSTSSSLSRRNVASSSPKHCAGPPLPAGTPPPGGGCVWQGRSRRLVGARFFRKPSGSGKKTATSPAAGDEGQCAAEEYCSAPEERLDSSEQDSSSNCASSAMTSPSRAMHRKCGGRRGPRGANGRVLRRRAGEGVCTPGRTATACACLGSPEDQTDSGTSGGAAEQTDSGTSASEGGCCAAAAPRVPRPPRVNRRLGRLPPRPPHHRFVSRGCGEQFKKSSSTQAKKSHLLSRDDFLALHIFPNLGGRDCCRVLQTTRRASLLRSSTEEGPASSQVARVRQLTTVVPKLELSHARNQQFHAQFRLLREIAQFLPNLDVLAEAERQGAPTFGYNVGATEKEVKSMRQATSMLAELVGRPAEWYSCSDHFSILTNERSFLGTLWSGSVKQLECWCCGGKTPTLKDIRQGELII